MPQAALTAVVFAAQAIGTAASATAVAVAGASAATLAAGAALASIAYTSYSQKKAQADARKDSARAPRDITVRSAIEPARIIYGTARTSGPVVYTNTAPTPGTNDNSTLWTVISLCQHEIEDITEIWLDGDQIPSSLIRWSTDGGVSSGKYGPIGGNYVTNFYRRLGTDTQTHVTELATAFSDWTSAYDGKGVAYIVTAFELGTATGEGVWAQGAPQNIRAVVKGKKVYDPRKDSTQTGGSGAHRLADPTTWEWSDNPALCLADYLFDARLGMGAEGVTYDDIDWDLVADAADVCDVSVTIPGGSEKRFTCNGALSTGETYAENIKQLLSSMSGQITWSGGKYRIRAAAYEAPTYTFTGDDVIGDVQIQPERTRTQRYNKIRGTYIDPSSDYVATEFIPVENTSYKNTRDGGQTLTQEIRLPFTNSEYMAQRIAFKQLNLNNQQLRCIVPFNWKAMKVAVGDRIQLSIEELSWSNKVFRVDGWSFSPDSGFNLTLQEDSSSAYADPLLAEYSTRTLAGTVSFADQAVSAPSGLQATSEEEAIFLEWEAPPRASGYDEVIVFASADSSWSNASEIARTRGNTYRHELTNGTERYYWVRAVDVDGRVSTRDPDSDTSAVTATAGQINTSQLNDDADFALTADWPSVTDSLGTAPADNATVGSTLGTDTYDTDGTTVLGTTELKNSVNKGKTIALLLNKAVDGTTNNGEGSLVGVDNEGEVVLDTDGFFLWNGTKYTVNREQYISALTYTFLTNVGGKKGYLVYDISGANFTVASTAMEAAFVWKEGSTWYYDNNSTGISFTPTDNMLALAYIETGATDVILRGGLLAEPVQLLALSEINADYISAGTVSTDRLDVTGIITAGGIITDSATIANDIQIGSGESVFKADSNGIYLGNETFANAEFRVTPAGALTATSATITGSITATSLNIETATVTGTLSAANIEVDGTSIVESSGQLAVASGLYYTETEADARFLQLTGGSLTGDLTITKTQPVIYLNDSNTTTGSYPAIEFNTSNNQGVRLSHNEIDGELPVGGYGLALGPSASNTQFPGTGTLTFMVLGEIYAGATSATSLHKVWHAGNDGSGSGLDADTVDGVQASSFLRSDANDSFSGKLTATGTAASEALDLATNDQYASMRVIRNAGSTPADGMYIGYANASSGPTRIFGGGSTTNKLQINNGSASLDGTFTATSNITAYSDERLKTDIETLDGSKVFEMRGVSFTKDGKKGSGVIAQELEKVAPELVMDGEFKSVAYGNLVGYLIEAIKELKAEIDELKNG